MPAVPPSSVHQARVDPAAEVDPSFDVQARPSLSEASQAADDRYTESSSFLIALGLWAAMVGGWQFVVSHWLPDTLAFGVAGHHLELAALHHKLLNSLILSLLAVFAVFVADLVLAGWRESSVRHLASGTRSARSDLVMFLADKLRLSRWILIGFTLGIGLVSGDWLHERIAGWIGTDFGLKFLPVYLQLPLAYLIYTYLDYWAHRVGHGSIFWPIHRFHHAAQDFCILTAVRVHPADLGTLLILTLPMTLLAPSIDALMMMYIWLAFVRSAIHSRIPSNWGWVGRWLVQSPLDHRMHHILDMSQGPGLNYGLLPLWDRLHGTYRPGGHPSLAIGVDDAPYRHGAWVLPDIVRDYGDFLKNVAAAVGLGARRLPQGGRDASTMAAVARPPGAR